MKKCIMLFLMFVLFAATALANGQWTSFLTNNSDTDYINSIVTEENTVWCATDGGIVKWDTVTGTYTVEKTGRFVSAAIDWDGVKWFGGDESIYALKNTSWTSFTKENTELLNKPLGGTVTSIVIDTVNKRIICGFYYTFSSHQGNDNDHYKLLSYDGDKWEELYDYMQSMNALPLVVDIENPWNIWSGGLGAGIYFYKKETQGYNQTYIQFDISDGGFRYIAIDSDKRLWMTTFNNIYLYDRTGLTPTPFSPKITGVIGRTWNIVIDRNWVKWFGSDGALVRYDDKTWSAYSFQPLDEYDKVTALAADESGNIWMGRGDSLSSIKGFGLWRFHLTDSGVNEGVALPKTITIIGNSPNPFNPSTTVSFSLPASGKAELAIYSITGQRVRTLVYGQLSAGTHSKIWDGRDDFGKPVSSGVYLSLLTAVKQTATGKMVLMR